MTVLEGGGGTGEGGGEKKRSSGTVMREGVGNDDDQGTLKIHMKLSKNNKSIGTVTRDRLDAGNSKWNGVWAGCSYDSEHRPRKLGDAHQPRPPLTCSSQVSSEPGACCILPESGVG